MGRRLLTANRKNRILGKIAMKTSEDSNYKNAKLLLKYLSEHNNIECHSAVKNLGIDLYCAHCLITKNCGRGDVTRDQWLEYKKQELAKEKIQAIEKLEYLETL